MTQDDRPDTDNRWQGLYQHPGWHGDDGNRRLGAAFVAPTLPAWDRIGNWRDASGMLLDKSTYEQYSAWEFDEDYLKDL